MVVPTALVCGGGIVHVTLSPVPTAPRATGSSSVKLRERVGGQKTGRLLVMVREKEKRRDLEEEEE